MKLTRFATAMVFSIALIGVASANTIKTIFEDDFESYDLGPLPTGLPGVSSMDEPSVMGDPSQITGAVTQGTDTVASRSGTQMMQFLNTHTFDPNAGTNDDMFYLFDLTEYSDAISTGNVSISLHAFFNTGASDWNFDTGSGYFLQVDNAYFMQLDAWSGDVSDFETNGYQASPHNLASIHNFSNKLLTDRDESTWEEGWLGLDLPTGTTYVSARIAANENMFANSSGDDFVSSFADDVRADLVGRNGVSLPETGPGVLMLSMAFAGFVVARRRFQA